MNFLVQSYACYKAERRWLLGLSKANAHNIQVPIEDNFILKPDLLCGEITQLVVTGDESGLIRSPSGDPLRYLRADATMFIRDLEEKEKYLHLLAELASTDQFGSCGENYSSLMIAVLSKLLSDKFDAGNFKKNVA